jgi:hypothetical protein
MESMVEHAPHPLKYGGILIELLTWLQPVDTLDLRFGKVSSEEGDTVDAVGLSTSIPFPLRCSRSIQDILSRFIQVVSCICAILVAAFIGGLYWRRRCRRAKMINNLFDEVMKDTRWHLSKAGDDGRFAIMLRDEIRGSLSDPAKKCLFFELVWPCVQEEFRVDNCIAKSIKLSHGNKLMHWVMHWQSRQASENRNLK